LDLAEGNLDYHFHDRDLGIVALLTWRPGFSRLEFLGDANFGFAVAADATLVGSEMRSPIKRINEKVIWWLKWRWLAMYLQVATSN
jgi:hypothetical protein